MALWLESPYHKGKRDARPQVSQLNLRCRHTRAESKSPFVRARKLRRSLVVSMRNDCGTNEDICKTLPADSARAGHSPTHQYPISGKVP